jgi:hypothetical protein
MTLETEGVTTESDKINTGALGTIVVVGTLALVGIAGALTALVRNEQEQADVALGARANVRAIQELRVEQRKTLNAPPAYVDRGASLASIPISGAMKLVVRDLERDPHSATPLKPEEQEKEEQEKQEQEKQEQEQEKQGEQAEPTGGQDGQPVVEGEQPKVPDDSAKEDAPSTGTGAPPKQPDAAAPMEPPQHETPDSKPVGKQQDAP